MLYVPYVTRGLHAFVPHMPHALSAVVPQVLCTLDPLSFASPTLYLTQSTVNHGDKQLLLKECYHSALFFFIKDINLEDPLIYTNLVK